MRTQDDPARALIDAMLDRGQRFSNAGIVVDLAIGPVPTDGNIQVEPQENPAARDFELI